MELRENLVICIGSAIIDITARVPYDFLQKYKLKPNNAISFNKDYSNIFDDLKEYKPTLSIGGSITHAVRSLQNLLEFPCTCYLGAIGKDDYGKQIYKELQKEKINVFFEEIDGVETSKCAVLLHEDNRSCVTVLGASKYFSLEFIERDDVIDAIHNGKYYYMSAFFFRVSYPITYKICTYANAENKMFVLNIGAPFLCSQYVKEFKEILPYVNILIGNEEESIQLATILGYLRKDVEDIVLFLHKQCCKSTAYEPLVIITRSYKPIIMAYKNEVTKFKVPALQIKKNLNTSGAGDYFLGGFLANLIQNKSIEECVRSGIELSHKLIEKNSSSISHN